ncbi:2,3-bisphosphoglycerate-dependent phosphoglycerate mutase [Streptomyces purpurascens]
MADAPYKLILLRHGESEWNEKNLFTGWVDVNLTAKGEKEATRGGELLKDAGLLPDVVHTSLQKRAIRTAQLSLESADRLWIPVHRSWRLNERHYGALQGKDKAQTLAEFGEEQFMLWRRSYDTPPPALDVDAEYSQFSDPRYATLPPELRPQTECLKDVVNRMLPYWFDAIVPDLLTGKTVLVAAHGNSLRALVKHLDGISDENIAGLNIPTGIPLSYELDSDFKPVKPGGPTWTLRRLRLPLRRSRTRGRRSSSTPVSPRPAVSSRGGGFLVGVGRVWAVRGHSRGPAHHGSVG